MCLAYADLIRVPICVYSACILFVCWGKQQDFMEQTHFAHKHLELPKASGMTFGLRFMWVRQQLHFIPSVSPSSEEIRIVPFPSSIWTSGATILNFSFTIWKDNNFRCWPDKSKHHQQKQKPYPTLTQKWPCQITFQHRHHFTQEWHSQQLWSLSY